VLRHCPLDVRLAGSEDGAQKGQHGGVDLITVCANISKIKFWKYSKVLSAFTPATRIGAHEGVGAFTKSAKAGIMHAVGRMARHVTWATDGIANLAS
jgi:hypothetical protein